MDRFRLLHPLHLPDCVPEFLPDTVREIREFSGRYSLFFQNMLEPDDGISRLFDMLDLFRSPVHPLVVGICVIRQSVRLHYRDGGQALFTDGLNYRSEGFFRF